MKKNLSKAIGAVAIAGIMGITAYGSDKGLVESSSSESITQIQDNSRIISKDFTNYPLNYLTNFTNTIKLSSSQPYGKVYYYNNSSSEVIIYVEGETPKTIKPYSGDSIIFKKSYIKTSYEYGVTAQEGLLNGSLSVGKATLTSEFQ